MEKIASPDEILAFLTCLLRGEIEPGRERLRAAELLGKRFGLFDFENGGDGGVVFIQGEGELR